MKRVIEKYGIKLRLVEEADAEFIVALRTDEMRSAYISPTSGDVSAQVQWIHKYKQREAEDKEYYFIAEKGGIAWGTIRIYNLAETSFESGSWVFLPDSPLGMPILAGILAREFAFDHYSNMTHVTFSVRKKNKQVLAYHLRYNPELTSETEDDFYFRLSREAWRKGADKYLRLLGVMNHG